MDRAPEDVQATYCATLVDEWAERGVTHAVIAPGSRSTPMALAITDRSEIRVHVVHDERSAAFVALGLGLDGVPSLLLCTSGTAAANFFPAVVEAGLSAVPMIVLTADRPAELRGVGAPQTIDQLHLYGDHVRWFADPGVPDSATSDSWRRLALDAWRHAAGGPVQLNLAFREPLVGNAGPLPSRSADPVVPVGDEARTTDPAPDMTAERGIILTGGRSGVSAAELEALREQTGWPIIADPVSGMRHLADAISTADALLRSARFADRYLPDVIVRVGRPAASKVLAQWTHRATAAGATLVQVGGPGRIDPDHDVTGVCSITDLLAATQCPAPRSPGTTTRFPAPGSPGTTSGWRNSWEHANRVADAAIRSTLSSFDDLTEPAVARAVADHLPDDATLTVASSMPVRDLEWFGGSAARAHANRGANGIDGVTSTALGVALGNDLAPSVLLIGDLAFVHDSSALVALSERGVDLRIVVVDNDGGGIFSFLPQAAALSTERFEQLFGTPLGVDVVALAAAHGLESQRIGSLEELNAQLAVPGPGVVCVRSDRQRNVAVHAALHDAVVDAVERNA